MIPPEFVSMPVFMSLAELLGARIKFTQKLNPCFPKLLQFKIQEFGFRKNKLQIKFCSTAAVGKTKWVLRSLISTLPALAACFRKMTGLKFGALHD